MGRHDLGRPGEPQGDISEMWVRVIDEHRATYPNSALVRMVDDAKAEAAVAEATRRKQRWWKR
ncbi:MAG TPA: hypothetical protein VJ914_19025 [Pseudonocardiaceae bacterium]|nr:hypothetical protein [Pseudonocardiaceae bacterium]